MKLRFNWNYLLLFILIFCIEVSIATVFKNLTLVRGFVGDVLVIPLIYCFVKIWIPKRHKLIAILTFLFGCFVEFLQYLNVVELLSLQNNKVASIVIGTVADWHDIFAYFIGLMLILSVEFLVKKAKPQ